MTTTASLPRAHADRARAYVERGRRRHADGDVAAARALFCRAIVHDALYEERLDRGAVAVRAETPEGGGCRPEQRYLLRKVRVLFVTKPEPCTKAAA